MHVLAFILAIVVALIVGTVFGVLISGRVVSAVTNLETRIVGAIRELGKRIDNVEKAIRGR